MYRTSQKLMSIIVLVAFSGLFVFGEVYAAVPTVKLVINPNKTDVDAGAEPVAITAQATGANLTYKWELVGPGKIEGSGSAVFYIVPEKIDRESAQAIVTVIVIDGTGQETTQSITFNILSKQPQPVAPVTPKPKSEGMSTGTKVALGIGAAAALGGGIALLAGGGGSDGGDDGGTLSVFGNWEFSGQLTRNTCEFNFGPSLTGTLNFIQNGVNVAVPDVTLNLAGELWYFSYAGRISGRNLSLAAVDPYVFQSGGTVIHFGSGIDIQNIKNNAGSGSLNITGACIQGCTGSCQTIWSGPWTRVSW